MAIKRSSIEKCDSGEVVYDAKELCDVNAFLALQLAGG